MPGKNKTIYLVGSLIVTASLLAACSGGGGGGTINPGGGGGPTPVPSPTAGLNGGVQVATGGTFASGFTYAAAGNTTLVFSCGCTAQAGTTTTDSSGQFTLVQNSQATPAAPNPTYTIVPGRNYILIAETTGGPEAWTTQFAGKNPNRNHTLNSSSPSDVFTAAVSLYVFANSTATATAFDDWNFNSLVAYYNHLTASPNTQETKLLNDIAAQSALNKPLFPSKPGWDSSQTTNATISADLASVKTSGAPVPTPCPTSGGGSNCTGAPTP
jgi:hypothetical protein